MNGFIKQEKNVKEAISSMLSQKWKAAMEKGICS